MKKQAIVIEAVCISLIILFVYAATSKLIDIEKFRIELGKSPLLTEYAGLVSVFIPVFELFIAILLCIKGARLFALNSAFSLLVLFTSYLIAILQFSFYVPCTCGGVLQSMNWNQHILFNCIFILLSTTAIILSPSKHELPAPNA
jgi:Methylamine utilisation protein MauE